MTINEAGAASKMTSNRCGKTNADEDRKQFELVEARNRANQYQLEKQMKEHEDKLTEDDTAPMNTAIEGEKCCRRRRYSCDQGCFG